MEVKQLKDVIEKGENLEVEEIFTERGEWTECREKFE